MPSGPAGAGATRTTTCDDTKHALAPGHSALDAEVLTELAFADIARHAGASAAAIHRARHTPAMLYIVQVGYFRSATRAATVLDSIIACVQRAQAEAKDASRQVALAHAWRPGPITVRYGVEATDESFPFPHLDTWRSPKRVGHAIVAGMHIEASAAMAQASAARAAGVPASIAVHAL